MAAGVRQFSCYLPHACWFVDHLWMFIYVWQWAWLCSSNFWSYAAFGVDAWLAVASYNVILLYMRWFVVYSALSHVLSYFVRIVLWYCFHDFTIPSLVVRLYIGIGWFSRRPFGLPIISGATIPGSSTCRAWTCAILRQTTFPLVFCIFNHLSNSSFTSVFHIVGDVVLSEEKRAPDCGVFMFTPTNITVSHVICTGSRSIGGWWTTSAHGASAVVVPSSLLYSIIQCSCCWAGLLKRVYISFHIIL